jgi:hypothetical protein
VAAARRDGVVLLAAFDGVVAVAANDGQVQRGFAAAQVSIGRRAERLPRVDQPAVRGDSAHTSVSFRRSKKSPN